MKPKKSCQIVFLQNVYRSGSEAKSLIVSIYIVFTFYFWQEHVSRQISAFCANFRFQRKSKCKQWQKKIRTDRNNLTFRLRHRSDTGIEYLIPKGKLRNLSVYLSVYQISMYVAVRLHIPFTYKCIFWNQMLVKLFM